MLKNSFYIVILSLLFAGGCLIKKNPVFESTLEVKKVKVPLKNYYFEFVYPAKYNDELMLVARKKDSDTLFFYEVKGEHIQLVQFRKLNDSILLKPMYDRFKDELFIERVFIVHPDTLLFYSRGTIHGDFSSWKIWYYLVQEGKQVTVDSFQIPRVITNYDYSGFDTVAPTQMMEWIPYRKELVAYYVNLFRYHKSAGTFLVRWKPFSQKGREVLRPVFPLKHYHRGIYPYENFNFFSFDKDHRLYVCFGASGYVYMYDLQKSMLTKKRLIHPNFREPLYCPDDRKNPCYPEKFVRIGEMTYANFFILPDPDTSLVYLFYMCEMPDRNHQGMKNIAHIDKRKGLYVTDKHFSKGKEYELKGAAGGFFYHYNIVLLKHNEIVSCGGIRRDTLYLYKLNLPWKK